MPPARRPSAQTAAPPLKGKASDVKAAGAPQQASKAPPKRSLDASGDHGSSNAIVDLASIQKHIEQTLNAGRKRKRQEDSEKLQQRLLDERPQNAQEGEVSLHTQKKIKATRSNSVPTAIVKLPSEADLRREWRARTPGVDDEEQPPNAVQAKKRLSEIIGVSRNKGSKQQTVPDQVKAAKSKGSEKIPKSTSANVSASATEPAMRPMRTQIPDASTVPTSNSVTKPNNKVEPNGKEIEVEIPPSPEATKRARLSLDQLSQQAATQQNEGKQKGKVPPKTRGKAKHTQNNTALNVSKQQIVPSASQIAFRGLKTASAANPSSKSIASQSQHAEETQDFGDVQHKKKRRRPKGRLSGPSVAEVPPHHGINRPRKIRPSEIRDQAEANASQTGSQALLPPLTISEKTRSNQKSPAPDASASQAPRDATQISAAVPADRAATAKVQDKGKGKEKETEAVAVPLFRQPSPPQSIQQSRAFPTQPTQKASLTPVIREEIINDSPQSELPQPSNAMQISPPLRPMQNVDSFFMPAFNFPQSIDWQGRIQSADGKATFERMMGLSNEIVRLCMAYQQEQRRFFGFKRPSESPAGDTIAGDMLLEHPSEACDKRITSTAGPSDPRRASEPLRLSPEQHMDDMSIPPSSPAFKMDPAPAHVSQENAQAHIEQTPETAQSLAQAQVVAQSQTVNDQHAQSTTPNPFQESESEDDADSASEAETITPAVPSKAPPAIPKSPTPVLKAVEERHRPRITAADIPSATPSETSKSSDDEDEIIDGSLELNKSSPDVNTPRAKRRRISQFLRARSPSSSVASGDEQTESDSEKEVRPRIRPYAPTPVRTPSARSPSSSRSSSSATESRESSIASMPENEMQAHSKDSSSSESDTEESDQEMVDAVPYHDASENAMPVEEQSSKSAASSKSPQMFSSAGSNHSTITSVASVEKPLPDAPDENPDHATEVNGEQDTSLIEPRSRDLQADEDAESVDIRPSQIDELADSQPKQSLQPKVFAPDTPDASQRVIKADMLRRSDSSDDSNGIAESLVSQVAVAKSATGSSDSSASEEFGRSPSKDAVDVEELTPPTAAQGPTKPEVATATRVMRSSAPSVNPQSQALTASALDTNHKANSQQTKTPTRPQSTPVQGLPASAVRNATGMHSLQDLLTARRTNSQQRKIAREVASAAKAAATKQQAMTTTRSASRNRTAVSDSEESSSESSSGSDEADGKDAPNKRKKRPTSSYKKRSLSELF